MHNAYTSDVLYHFVGRGTLGDEEKTFDTLLKVIGNMCVSHPPFNTEWGATTITINPDFSIIGDKLVAPNITCFCDIPLESQSIHYTKYGRFGVGVDKSFLTYYGCRPVMYFPYSESDRYSPYGKSLIQDIEAKYKRLFKLADKEDLEEYSHFMGEVPDHAQLSCIESAFSKDFLAFVKAYNCTLPKEHADCFYMEREWRRIGNVMLTDDSLKQIVIPESYKGRLLDKHPELESKIVPLK